MIHTCCAGIYLGFIAVDSIQSIDAMNNANLISNKQWGSFTIVIVLSMNEHYIKTIDENELYNQLLQYCELFKEKIDTDKESKLKLSLSFLKNKAKTLEDIYNNAKYIIVDEVDLNQEDFKLIDDNAKKIISDFSKKFSTVENLTKETLEPILNDLIKSYETNFKSVGQPLRIILTGSKFGPGIYDIIISLGKVEVEKRLNKLV